MKSKLGRNPFQSHHTHASRTAEHAPGPPETTEEVAPVEQDPVHALVDWFTVELPSELFVLGLKTILVVRDSISDFKNKK